MSHSVAEGVNPVRQEPQQKLLCVSDVMAIMAIRSRSTIFRRIRKSEFPQPINIGGGKIRWDPDEFFDWLNQLPKKRY
jgi:prophage regulatory protein